MFCFRPETPGLPIITLDVQATSVSVTWTAPDNGGSPITGYRVVLLQGDSVIKNESGPNKLSWSKGELIKNTSYTVKVSARNFVFEGNAAERKFATKYEGMKLCALCSCCCSLLFLVGRGGGYLLTYIWGTFLCLVYTKLNAIKLASMQ